MKKVHKRIENSKFSSRKKSYIKVKFIRRPNKKCRSKKEVNSMAKGEMCIFQSAKGEMHTLELMHLDR